MKENNINIRKVNEKEFRVIKIDTKNNSLVVQSLKNEKLQFQVNLDQYSDRFSVFEQKSINLAAGDKVVTLLNSKEDKVKNGQMWEVKEIQGNKITLHSGKTERTIDISKYKYIEHGYALTIHKKPRRNGGQSDSCFRTKI